MALVTHGGVVAQVWRGGHGRQTRLALALNAVQVEALDLALGRNAGLLMARSGMSDAVDAAIVAMTGNDERIITSDLEDIGLLVAASGRRIDIVPA